MAMEGRKWEELPRDCLVDVFGRVGIESLLLDIPFVCKSWYQAILTPLCWKQLDFPDLFTSLRFLHEYIFVGTMTNMKFVKGVVDRSAGRATYVNLPSCYGEKELSYIADKCPALKTLVRQAPDLPSMLNLLSVIRKFKNLEMLGIEVRFCGSHFKDIVTQIGMHCQNFTALSFVSDSRFFNACIGEDEALTIVSCLPKLMALTLRWVRIERVNLIKLLKGCVGLVHLDVRDCYGFDEDDREVLELASHIPIFESSGSVDPGYDYSSDSEDHIDLDFDYASD